MSGSLVDLGKFAEPVSKLIEALRDGAGVLYEPTRIRRKAKAEADALTIMAEGRVEAADIEERARRRVSFLENRRQQNIESIVDKAVEELTGKSDSRPLETDWVTHFLTSAQDSSDSTIQHLWARILGGETEQPGTFSKRLVDFVRLLSREEANEITEYCRHAWVFGREDDDSPDAVILVDRLIEMNAPSRPKEPFVSFGTRLGMKTIGVAAVETGLGIRLKRDHRYLFSIHGRTYSAFNNDYLGENLAVDVLSSLGRELLKLCSDAPAPEDYIEACVHQYHLEKVETNSQSAPNQ